MPSDSVTCSQHAGDCVGPGEASLGGPKRGLHRRPHKRVATPGPKEGCIARGECRELAPALPAGHRACAASEGGSTNVLVHSLAAWNTQTQGQVLVQSPRRQDR